MTSSLPYAARYLVPYVRLFTIWKYGPIYDRIDGRYIRDGWFPDEFGEWEVSRAEAERIFEAAQ